MIPITIDTVRALVRPIITVSAFVSVIVLLFLGRLDEAKWFAGSIAIPVTLWWYAERTANKTRQP